jgi:hypothetical protein
VGRRKHTPKANPVDPVLLAIDPSEMGGEWTERQRRFAIAYLRHGIGARAVREAGYQTTMEGSAGYAWWLLKQPHIAAFVREKQAAMRGALEIDANTVLGELAKVGFFNMGRIVEIDEHGPKINLEEATTADMAAISEIEVRETTQRIAGTDDYETVRTIRIKAAPKQPALEALGRNLKLFKDQLELSGTVNVAETIVAARQRLAAARKAEREAEDET